MPRPWNLNDTTFLPCERDLGVRQPAATSRSRETRLPRFRNRKTSRSQRPSSKEYCGDYLGPHDLYIQCYFETEAAASEFVQSDGKDRAPTRKILSLHPCHEAGSSSNASQLVRDRDVITVRYAEGEVACTLNGDGIPVCLRIVPHIISGADSEADQGTIRPQFAIQNFMREKPISECPTSLDEAGNNSYVVTITYRETKVWRRIPPRWTEGTGADSSNVTMSEAVDDDCHSSVGGNDTETEDDSQSWPVGCGTEFASSEHDASLLFGLEPAGHGWED